MIKLSLTSRWTERAKGAALVGAIAAGVASGYAFAISPTVDTARTFAGGVSVNKGTATGIHVPFYTVPAGQAFTLTDLVATNFGTGFNYFQVEVSSSTDCEGDRNLRLNSVVAPSLGTVHLPLVSGISVNAGKTVCIFTPDVLSISVRGFLADV